MLALAFVSIFGKFDLALACWIVALTFIPSVTVGVIWLKPGKPDISEIKAPVKLHKAKSGMVAIVGIASMGLRQFLCSSRRLVAWRCSLGCIKIGTIYLRSAKRVTAGN